MTIIELNQGHEGIFLSVYGSTPNGTVIIGTRRKKDHDPFAMDLALIIYRDNTGIIVSFLT
jgi:hypothetical protein